MIKHKKLGIENENGFASIVITLVLILILGLVTIGFAQLARREQQNALDKQLSTQAIDASESGINDMQQLVQQAENNPGGSGTTPSLTSITPTNAGGNEDPNKCLGSQNITGYPASSGGYTQIDPNTGAAYSCVLLDISPPDLTYSGVSPLSQVNATFSVYNNTCTTSCQLGSLTISWGHDGSSPVSPLASAPPSSTSGKFTPVGQWNHPAVIQFSITPLSAMDRSSLINNTYTVYLYPSSSGSNNATYSMGGVNVISGSCAASGSYPCSVNLGGIVTPPPASGTTPQYLIHMVDYYDVANVDINNAKDTSNKSVVFVGAQAQIDVTGRSKNTLKREQVRTPLNQPTSSLLEAQNLCKQFDTAPTDPVSNPRGTAYYTTTDPSCDLSS